MENVNILGKITQKTGKKRIFYACRDIERAAAGLLLSLPNFYIITNDSIYARALKKKYQNILLVENTNILNTCELLKNSTSLANIKPGDHVVVFKPTKQVEQLCKINKWNLLNPPSELGQTVEEKISQIKWLGPLAKYLPKYEVNILKKITWKNKKFILQFNHTHTGEGTYFIKNRKDLEHLQNKFPDRPARVSEFIDGPIFTNNNVVWGDKVLIGSINYQITGLRPFTDNPFATVGNDWGLPSKILSEKFINQYHKMATDIGKRLAKNNWRGLFGIDVVFDVKNEKLYLIEINARQPASTSYESELQFGQSGITTFAAHLAALLKIAPGKFELAQITDGAQIILRTQNTNRKFNFSKLNNFKLIEYENSKLSADRLRIQSKQGIMSEHTKFNKFGQEISHALI